MTSRVHHIDFLVHALEAAGIRLTESSPRRGVEGWKLVDLEMEETFGVYTQLVEEEP